jgi:flagellar L-ring protein precursor FlgH
MLARHALALGALAALLLGCGPRHIGAMTAKQRNYTPGAYAQRDPSAKPAPGSLFSEAGGGYLEDTRAVRVGDIVVIVVSEAADAQGNATTKLSRDSTAQMGMDSFFGAMATLQKAHPSIDPSKLLSFASQSAFQGDGNTTRAGKLDANIAVRVTREMPNGDLFLEGTKVILINNEEYHLYVSGVVRRADIGQDNAVSSSRIADAQLEFTGRGDMADQQRKGWFSRSLDTVTPF